MIKSGEGNKKVHENDESVMYVKDLQGKRKRNKIKISGDDRIWFARRSKPGEMNRNEPEEE